jgi:hypothetical protein
MFSWRMLLVLRINDTKMSCVYFYRTFYSPHNISCLTVISVHSFVWWFLKVKADGWRVDLTPPRTSLWPLIGSLCISDPKELCLEFKLASRWILGQRHTLTSPRAASPTQDLLSRVVEVCGQAPPSHHLESWFPQLAYFVLCLWNFLLHRSIFPSLLSLNKI